MNEKIRYKLMLQLKHLKELTIQDGQIVTDNFTPLERKLLEKWKRFSSKMQSFFITVSNFFNVSPFLTPSPKDMIKTGERHVWESKPLNTRSTANLPALYFWIEVKLFFGKPVYFVEKDPNFERYKDFQSFTLGHLGKFCNLDNLDILGNLGTVGCFEIWSFAFLSCFCLFLAFLGFLALFVFLVFQALWTFVFFWVILVLLVSFRYSVFSWLSLFFWNFRILCFWFFVWIFSF